MDSGENLSRGVAARRWWLLSLVRRFSTSFVRAVFGFLGAAMWLMPSKSDQTRFACSAKRIAQHAAGRLLVLPPREW